MNERERIIKKFVFMSEKYHKMSLLFYELSQSLNIEFKPIENSRTKIKEYLKNKLNLDYDKIINLSNDLSNLSLNDLKRDERREK